MIKKFYYRQVVRDTKTGREGVIYTVDFSTGIIEFDNEENGRRYSAYINDCEDITPNKEKILRGLK